MFLVVRVAVVINSYIWVRTRVSSGCEKTTAKGAENGSPTHVSVDEIYDSPLYFPRTDSWTLVHRYQWIYFLVGKYVQRAWRAVMIVDLVKYANQNQKKTPTLPSCPDLCTTQEISNSKCYEMHASSFHTCPIMRQL